MAAQWRPDDRLDDPLTLAAIQYAAAAARHDNPLASAGDPVALAEAHEHLMTAWRAERDAIAGAA